MTFPGFPCGFSGSMLIFWKVNILRGGLPEMKMTVGCDLLSKANGDFFSNRYHIWSPAMGQCCIKVHQREKICEQMVWNMFAFFLAVWYVWIIPVFELAIYTWSILKLVTMGKQLPLGRPSRRPRYSSRAALGCARYPVWKLRGSAGRMVHWLVSRGYLAAILMKILLDILSKWVKVFDPRKFGRRTAELVVSWD